MASPSPNMIEMEEVIKDKVEVKVEGAEEKIVKASYTLGRTKKLKEMKENLKRNPIVESNTEEDVYSFKIEPGCYSEISKKLRESVVGDELNDDNVASENPVGIKMK